MITETKAFWELKIGEEFWDYHPDDQGDCFIKTGINSSIQRERKYVVDWSDDDIVDVEIKESK